MIDRNKIDQKSLLNKNIDDFFSKSQYICSMFSSKCFECARSLCGTSGTSRTIQSYLSYILNKRSSTTRTNSWWCNELFISISYFDNGTNNFGYNFSGSDDKYLVSFHNSFFRKLIIVMKSRTTHCYSSYIYWFQNSYWSNNSRSSDRMLYREKFCTNIGCRKFVRNRISRMMFGSTELFPKCQIIQFNDQSIDFEIEYWTTES